MKKGFIFDLNKCVGCHACIVACQIENGDIQNQAWREVSTFNLYQHPDFPLFNFSLACNHCKEAPCMNNCPALAYSKQKGQSGIEVIYHNAERCIGCKYCSWLCPYDAPKFISSKGVVEKCTLCFDRLNEGLKPACANLCPTSALDFNTIDIQIANKVNGFTEMGIKPAIKIIPLRNNNSMENSNELSLKEKDIFQSLLPKPKSEISLFKDWTLVVFTLLTAVLTSLMVEYAFTGSGLPPLLIGGLGLLGMGISLIHLGKKSRAWYALLNLRRSWLSREIFFYAVFVVFIILASLMHETKQLAFIASLFGFVTLFAIDKVYVGMQRITPLNTNSSSVFISGLLFAAILLSSKYVFSFLILIKLFLYLYRKIHFYSRAKDIYWFLSLIRIGVGILIPFILILFTFADSIIFIMIFVLVGEIIDRCEFYMDLEVITPEKQILTDQKISLGH